MARISKPFLASDEERDELLLLIRSLKLGKRYEDRAKVIILSLDSKSLDEIMVSTQTVIIVSLKFLPT